MRRVQILDEALRMIGQHGFNGVTLQKLAEQCGLSNAGLLHYFGSKDQLLLALLDEMERREAAIVLPLIAGIEQEVALGRSTLPAVHEFFRILVRRFGERPEMGRFIAVVQAEAIDPTHPAHDAFLRQEVGALAVFARILAPFVEEPHLVARWLHALMIGLAQQWLRSGSEFDLLAHWERALAAILPPGTATEHHEQKRDQETVK